MVQSGVGVALGGGVVHVCVVQQEEEGGGNENKCVSLDQVFEYFDSHTDVPLCAIRWEVQTFPVQPAIFRADDDDGFLCFTFPDTCIY